MAELLIAVVVDAFGAVAVFLVGSLLRQWLARSVVPAHNLSASSR